MKITEIIYNTFVILLLLVTLLFAASAIPVPGNYRVLTVLSGSMQPAIATGSVVIVKPATNYVVGDIITFGPAGKTMIPTTHRVKEIQKTDEQTLYITQGDANNAPDERAIAPDEIHGKVLFSIPFLGYAQNFVRQPIGFILFIVLPAVLIISDEVKNIFSSFKTAEASLPSKKPTPTNMLNIITKVKRVRRIKRPALLAAFTPWYRSIPVKVVILKRKPRRRRLAVMKKAARIRVRVKARLRKRKLAQRIQKPVRLTFLQKLFG